MNLIRVTLKISVDSEMLAKAICDSVYMESRGYEVLYSKKYADNDFRLCHSHDQDLLYIHFRIPTQGLTPEFKYFIACGDENIIKQDIANLVLEVERKFS